MGVSSEHILLYGWKIGYETANEWGVEVREQYYYDNSEAGDVVLVFDGMRGEYALLGVLQFCSPDRRWDSADIPLQPISEPTRDQERQLYETAFKELGLSIDADPEHYLLTHHS